MHMMYSETAFHLIFETRALTQPREKKKVGQTGLLSGDLSVSASWEELGLQIHATAPGFSMGLGNLKPNAPACTTGTLPTEQCPLPTMSYMNMKIMLASLLSCGPA